MENDLATSARSAAILVSLALFATACGSGTGVPGSTGSNSGSYDPNGLIDVANLAVTGTGTSNGIATIDPHTNGGAFTISYTVSGPGAGLTIEGYSARLFTNLNGQYNGGTPQQGDYQISAGCGQVNATDSCKASPSYVCSFNTSNVVTCPGVNATYPPLTQDITPILTTIPQSAYVVVYVCNTWKTHCASQSVAVIYQ